MILNVVKFERSTAVMHVEMQEHTGLATDRKCNVSITLGVEATGCDCMTQRNTVLDVHSL